MIGHGSGVSFLTLKDFTATTVYAPTYSTIKTIVVSIVTHSKSLVVAYVYCTPGSYSSSYLGDFLFLLLSSLTRHISQTRICIISTI